MEFDLCKIDWTAVAAIASFIMVLITAIALLQNHSQVKELRRQWEEQNRPRLHFSVVSKEDVYFLKIKNSGKETAYNISLNISEDFIKNHYHKDVKNWFIKLQKQKFHIEENSSNYYYICQSYNESDECDTDKNIIPCKTRKNWLNNNINKKIDITGSYCDGKYKINTSFAISNFITPAMVMEDGITRSLEWIKKGSVIQNDEKKYMPIQKSLHDIAEALKKDKR